MLPVALALLALAGCGPKPPAPAANDADPALWVVKDTDTTIYLFGTVHMLRPGLSWFDEGVKAAFDKSDTLMLEVVLPGEAEMGTIVRELGTGPSLPAQLPAAEGEQLRAALSGLGMPPDMLDTSEPWLAATLLSTLPLQKLGYDPADGAEAVLTGAARKAGKQIGAFETVREQLGYFDTLSMPAQRAMLSEAIRTVPKAGETLGTAIAAWSKGDPDKLAALINDDVAVSPEVAQALLYKRNQRWADWIAKRMAQPGTVFVAVGAGHLAGKGEVQAELARRGLKVERVAY